MKRKNLIKLFSLMLCASTLFVGCKGGEDSSNSVNFGAADPIDAIRSNFLSFEYAQEWKEYQNYTDLTNEYGRLWDSNKELYVFKKQDKDFMNNVTETFTVYNANKAQIVLTVQNIYADGNYDKQDKFENEKHAPTEMDVSVYDVSNIPYIEVEKRTYTKLDEELIEKEELDASYEEKYLVEYYDVAGTKLTEANLPVEVKSRGATSDKQKVLFGRTIVMLDKNTGEKIASWDAEKDSVHSLFTYENEWYGYYIPPYATSGSAIEVYNKKDKLVLRYELEDESFTSAYPLQCGNMILQKLTQTTASTYDFEMDEVKFDMQTLLLDVKTGRTQEIPFEYYLAMGVQTAETLKTQAEEGIVFTENVVNFGIGFKVEGAPLDDSNTAGIFFDNAGNVQYVMEKMYPEHSGFDAKKLANGDYYLIDLNSPVASQAIITEDGDLVCYLPDGATVIGDYILKGLAIYDYSLNCKYEFDSLDGELGWSYQGHLGNRLLLTRTYMYDDTTYYDSYVVNLDSYAIESSHYSGRFVEVDADGNYAIFQDNNGDYKLYTYDYRQIFSSENKMTVRCFDKALIAEVVVAGETICYAVAVQDDMYGW